MAVSVIMPRQGQSVESCILTEWKKKVGDQVKVGDILFAYETDKASFEEEAKVDGTLLAVFFNEQDDIPCLEEVAVIGNPGEDISAFGPKKGEAKAEAPAAAPAAEAPKAEAPAAKAERSKDATAVIMPRQGQSVESCILTEWKKKVGDEVHVGDILFSYETDKASFEEEAKVDGTLLAVFFNEQDDIPCLEEVAVIGKPGTSVAGFGPAAAQKEVPAETPAAAPAAAEAPAAEIKAEATGVTTGISPRARNTAARLGVDLSGVTATGPHGRILERDVMEARKATSGALLAGAAGIEGTGIGGRVTLADIAAAKNAPAAEAPKTEAPAEALAEAPKAEAAYTDVKIPNIRKVIAKSMTTSLSTMAQLTLNTSFDATAIVNYRGLLKGSADEAVAKITYNDFMIFAVSRIVKKYANINAHWLDKEGVIRQFKHVHVGMAVDTPRGLMVPTIFDADTKSLLEISQEAKALAAECKTGSINPDKLSGASITISNVGAFGIESFTPVINPPQTAILGVCGMEDKVRAGKDGQIELYKAMGLSLTIDHRALDGADGARFLKELCAEMANFSVLLAQ